MKTKAIKLFTLLLTATFFIACSEKESSNDPEQIKTIEQVSRDDNEGYLESIGSISSRIDLLKSSKELQSQEIKFLSSKRDSLQIALQQIENSLAEIKAKKITPGIDGVNKKLNELKGQKENLEEHLNLQNQEIILAQKKIELLNEEKTVYDAQKQALWDKGAPPEDFTELDQLLSGINQKISEQKVRLKNLNRNVSDIEEQIVSIKEQRTSLSNKIRNNYTAKEIFEGFSKEETERLSQEIKAIDEKLKFYLDKDSELANELAIKAGERSNLESKQNRLLEEAKSKEIESLNEIRAVNKAKKKSRLSYAVIGIGILALIMMAFYFVGKKKREKINK